MSCIIRQLRCDCRQIRAIPNAKDELEESEKYVKLLLETSGANLPLHLPEDVMGLMAPAVLYPAQMDGFYSELASSVPCTWEMMVRPSAVSYAHLGKRPLV